jgi:hypothetical protein
VGKNLNIWFAYTDHITRETVEPLHDAAIKAGYACSLSTRKGYDDLVDRMRPFTHYVFGVGCDASWMKARESNTVGIYIQHGQYVLNTWRAPCPDIAIVTGPVYKEDIIKNLRRTPRIIEDPGYIRAPIIRTYKNAKRDIHCLATLPHFGEHRRVHWIDLIEQLSDLDIVYRVHPRNKKTKKALQEMGLRVDENETFYDSLSRCNCVLSGPSNCIMECCIHGVPVGVISLPENGYHHLMKNSYESIAQIFDSIGSLRAWVSGGWETPTPNDVGRYWSNTDGEISNIIRVFLNLLEKENARTPASL